MDRMITMHARPRQTDIQTDEHHSNSATIRALKRVYGRNRKAAKAAFTSVTAKQTIAYMYKHNINNEMWNTHTKRLVRVLVRSNVGWLKTPRQMHIIIIVTTVLLFCCSCCDQEPQQFTEFVEMHLRWLGYIAMKEIMTWQQTVWHSV